MKTTEIRELWKKIQQSQQEKARAIVMMLRGLRKAK